MGAQRLFIRYPWARGGAGVIGGYSRGGAAENALASSNALYDEDWAFAVHFPAFDHYDYDGRDLYVQHTLEPGESRRFEGWFQVVERGDLSALVAAESQREQRPVGTVAGRVETESGEQVAAPAVVAFRDGRPYTWALGTDGHYELALPEGEYTLYGTARAHSRRARQDVALTPGDRTTQSFSGWQAPGEVRLPLNDQQGPVDARIDIAEGETPLIGFLGRSIFFTEAGEPGTATFPIAPGAYRTIVPKGAEGVTPPEYVFRSQLAARLDLVFVSDHDTVEYLPAVAELADAGACRSYRRSRSPLLGGTSTRIRSRSGRICRSSRQR